MLSKTIGILSELVNAGQRVGAIALGELQQLDSCFENQNLAEVTNITLPHGVSLLPHDSDSNLVILVQRELFTAAVSVVNSASEDHSDLDDELLLTVSLLESLDDNKNTLSFQSYSKLV